MSGKTWKTIMLAVVAFLCLNLLFVGGPQSYTQRSYEYAWGLGHILCFVVWSILFLQWRSRWSYSRKFWSVFALTLSLGIAIEIIQVAFGRYFDPVDVLNNLTGSLLVLAFFESGRHSLFRSRLILLQVTALLFLFVGLFPLGRALYDEHRAQVQFPLLSDFESSLELGRWEGNIRLSISPDHASHGEFSLKAELTTDQYSGPFLRFFPEDWRGFNVLAFDLYNQSESELVVTCRVHDRLHAASGKVTSDRFNRIVSLAPGWTKVELSLEEIARAPQGRLLDLEHIAGLGIFVTELEVPKTLYLDHVRLR